MPNYPFTPAEFSHIYSQVPRLTVDLVIKTTHGIILTKRNHDGWLGQWHLPGGTVYLNEPVTTTVQRIAQEELGFKVEIKKCLGYVEYHDETIQRGFGYSVSLGFLCTTDSNVPEKSLDGEQLHTFSTAPPDIVTSQVTLFQCGLETELNNYTLLPNLTHHH